MGRSFSYFSSMTVIIRTDCWGFAFHFVRISPKDVVFVIVANLVRIHLVNFTGSWWVILLAFRDVS